MPLAKMEWMPGSRWLSAEHIRLGRRRKPLLDGLVATPVHRAAARWSASARFNRSAPGARAGPRACFEARPNRPRAARRVARIVSSGLVRPTTRPDFGTPSMGKQPSRRVAVVSPLPFCTTAHPAGTASVWRRVAPCGWSGALPSCTATSGTARPAARSATSARSSRSLWAGADTRSPLAQLEPYLTI